MKSRMIRFFNLAYSCPCNERLVTTALFNEFPKALMICCATLLVRELFTSSFSSIFIRSVSFILLGRLTFAKFRFAILEGVKLFSRRKDVHSDFQAENVTVESIKPAAFNKFKKCG